jgi:hypothetical protein
MLKWLERWPAALWLPMYVASVFILIGGRGHWVVLGVGIAVALVTCVLAVYLALKRWPNRPRPRLFVWAIGGVVALYVIAGVVGAAVDLSYGIAAVLAVTFPLTAVALLLALMRTKTIEHDGHLIDASAEDDEDAFPGFGMDDETEMGDSPELADAGVDPVEESRRRVRRVRGESRTSR